MSLPLTRVTIPVLVVLGLFSISVSAQGLETQAGIDPEPVIEARTVQTPDADIKARLEAIFAEIESLSSVSVAVKQGVVSLGGSVANEDHAERANNIAIRIQGVVTVQDGIERTLDLDGNLSPMLDQARADMDRWINALPLFLVALLVFLVIVMIGHWIARRTSLWQRMLPNPFLAELGAQAFRVAAIVLGLVAALSLLGAGALIGTILGSAGLLGIAIGFAVRDTLENYISSIMLSIRQPFRAHDHIVVGDHEGLVVRLTSRATILMTVDGNHLRIPNSTVFKSVILNYTRNPERRFDFELGVDAEDDPIAAMHVGVEALSELEFVLAEPATKAYVQTVGDSNIVLVFQGWLNQEEADFLKARSRAIAVVKSVLEAEGFTLPEPIYRVRLEDASASLLGTSQSSGDVEADSSAAESAQEIADEGGDAQRLSALRDELDDADVSPDRHIEEKIEEERAAEGGEDLLDQSRPIE